MTVQQQVYPAPRTQYHSLIKGTRFLGKITGSRAGQAKYKMSFEHLIVPESKEVLKMQRNGDML